MDRKQVPTELELCNRDALEEIFERARRRGHVPTPEEAMRVLREQNASLFQHRNGAKVGSGRPAEGASRMGASLHRAAYIHAVKLFHRAMGVSRGRPPLSPQQIAETQGLKEQGKTNQEIADKLNITRGAVIKRRRKASKRV